MNSQTILPFPNQADQYSWQLESPICMAVRTSGWLSSPQTPNLVLRLSLNYLFLPNPYWQVAVELAAAPLAERTRDLWQGTAKDASVSLVTASQTSDFTRGPRPEVICLLSALPTRRQLRLFDSKSWMAGKQNRGEWGGVLSQRENIWQPLAVH